MLSKRLEKIASFVPADSCVADIGSDHALLLIALAQTKQSRYGIAGEINHGPYRNAVKRIEMEGLSDHIEVRLGDGLAILRPAEVDVIVIAGMGGHLIQEILERGKKQLCGVKRLILQANQSVYRVRNWLSMEGWRLIAEDIVLENGIHYEILLAEPGDEAGLYEDERVSAKELKEIGPLLWKNRHPLLLSRLKEEFAQKEKVLQQVIHARAEKGVQRRIALQNQLNEWSEVIQCLTREKN